MVKSEIMDEQDSKYIVTMVVEEKQRHCLMALLETKFYSLCENHGSKNTFFCLTCLGLLLCEECSMAEEHDGHDILKVYKASHQVAIKIDDLKGHINVSCIQPYINNDSKIVYISQRRQKDHQLSTNSNSTPKCNSCGWQLLSGTTSKFCSIQCKFNYEEDIKKQSPNKIRIQRTRVNPNNQSSFSYRKKSRKGTPRRSPFY